MPQKTTIADVAKRAQTSIATVSYAMNGRFDLISGPMARHVLQIAAELRYRPSRHARQLSIRSNKTLAIGLDTSSIYRYAWMPSFPLFQLIQQGFSTLATAHGYRVHLLINGPDEDGISVLESQVLRENAVDGVVLFSTLSKSLDRMLDVVQRLGKAGVAMATVGEPLVHAGVPIVSVDLRPAIERAVKRLAELHCRHVAYIGRLGQSDHERMPRHQIFCDALRAAGIRLTQTCDAADKGVAAYELTLDLIEQGKLPDCIIYGADHLAMAGLDALKRRGIEAPRDVRVLGVDCAPYAADAPVPLASLDLRYFDWGQALARVLLDQIEQPNAAVPPRTTLDAEFVDNVSLGAPGNGFIEFKPVKELS